MSPPRNLEPKQTVIELLVEEPVAPLGRFQTNVAPAIGGTEYTTHWPLQTPIGPDIGPGFPVPPPDDCTVTLAVAVQPDPSSVTVTV